MNGSVLSQRLARCRAAVAHAESLRRRLGLALALLTLALLTSCLSRPALKKQSFVFSLAPKPSAASARSSRGPLDLRRVEVAAPYDSQSFVYRTGEFSYEQDPYAQFLVPPAEALSTALRGGFRSSGAFSAVTEPGSALQASVSAEIYIDQLYGDFRNPAQPAAVLSARVLFFADRNGVPDKAAFQKDYTFRVPLKARTAAALMNGWNQELDQLIQKAIAEFRTNSPPGREIPPSLGSSTQEKPAEPSRGS